MYVLEFTGISLEVYSRFLFDLTDLPVRFGGCPLGASDLFRLCEWMTSLNLVVFRPLPSSAVFISVAAGLSLHACPMNNHHQRQGLARNDTFNHRRPCQSEREMETERQTPKAETERAGLQIFGDVSVFFWILFRAYRTIFQINLNLFFLGGGGAVSFCRGARSWKVLSPHGSQPNSKDRGER